MAQNSIDAIMLSMRSAPDRLTLPSDTVPLRLHPPASTFAPSLLRHTPVALDCVHCGKVDHAVTEHAVARPSEWCDACTALPLLRTWLHVVDWCRWGVQVPRMHRSAMASRS
jgi:hypothetical protein